MTFALASNIYVTAYYSNDANGKLSQKYRFSIFSLFRKGSFVLKKQRYFSFLMSINILLKCMLIIY